jgi:hypothetical protein
MLFFQTFITNLVLTKSSGPKSHAVVFTAPILPVSVCVTQVSVGVGGKELAYTIDLSRLDMIPATLLSVWQPSPMGVGSISHKSCGRICSHP